MSFKAGAVVGEAILDTSKWDGPAKGLTSGTDGMAKKMGPLGVAIGVIGAGLAAAAAVMVTSIKAANEYQKSIGNITSIANGSTKSFQSMSREILLMDSSLGGAKEMADAMYQAISAGANPGKDALDLVTNAAKFARAGLTNTTVAVDVLTTAVNAYGKETVSAEKASNVFFATTQYGKLTAEQLASSIGKSIPLFSALKVPIEQLSAGMAAMTLSGVSAEESATQLNAVMNAFLKPSAEMTAALKKTAEGSADAFIKAHGLSGALELLQKETGGSTEKLSKLIPDIQGVRGALALSGEGAKNYDRILREMNKGLNVTDEAFRRQEKTFATLKDTMGRTELIIGNVGKAFADKLAVGVQDSIVSLNQFLLSAQGMEFFATAAERVGMVIGTIKGVFSVLIDDLSGPFKSTFEDIQKAFKELIGSGQTGINVFDVLGGVVKVIRVSFGLWADSIRVAYVAIIDVLKVGKGAINVFTTMWDILRGKKLISEYTSAMENLQDTIGNVFTDIAANQLKVVTNFGGNVVKIFTETGKASSAIADQADKTSEAAGRAVVQNYVAWTTGVNKVMFDQTAQMTVLTKEQADILYNGSEAQVKIRKEALEQQIKDQKRATERITEEAIKLEVNSRTPLERFAKWMDDSFSQSPRKAFDQFKFYFDAIANVVSTTVSGLVTTQQMANDLELANLKKNNKARTDALTTQYTKEKTALKDKLDKNLISQETFDTEALSLEKSYDTSKQALDDQASNEANTKAKEQFENMKALRIAQVWIDAASAIVGFWAAYGGIPTAGPIIAGVLSGVVTGIAGVQTGIISAQEYTPAYASGTDYHPGGAAIVGEQGPEIVNLPTGSQVIPAPISRSILDTQGSAITINFNGAVVREKSDFDKIVNAIELRLGQKMRYA